VNSDYKFFGSHELQLDDKNRLLVPSEFRKLINPEKDTNSLILVIGSNRKICLYPERYYETRFLSELQEDTAPDELDLQLEYIRFAMATRLPIDNQGRILLPERVLTQTRLGRQVTLLGMLNRLELWNRAEWDVQQTQLIDQSGELTLKKRRALAEKERQAQFRTPTSPTGSSA
jgi:MraZ protein